MIDIKEIRPGRLRDTPVGSLFVAPATGGNELFLAGRVNDIPVLIVLNGEEAFSAAQTAEWRRGPGLIIKNVRFEVDADTAISAPSETSVPVGSLALMGDGIAIIGAESRQRYAVHLSEDGKSRPLGSEDIVFTSWRLVSGSIDNPVEHLKAAAPAADGYKINL